MKPDPVLDLVIVNWRSGLQLEDCLDSIARQKPAKPISVVVVNNALEDLSVGSHGKKIKLDIMTPAKNLGFGGGCNYGALQGNADWVLFLNPDITLPEGSLHKVFSLIRAPDLPADIGIIGVRLLNPDGTVQRNVARFPRFWHFFPRMLGLDRVLPGLFPPHFVADMDYTRSQYVDQVPGGFFLVRRKAFDHLDGFDTRFFMYYEDLDFALRSLQAGWKTWYQADMEVHHLGGGTTRQVRDQALFYMLRSRVQYTARHYGRPEALLVLYAEFVLELPARLVRAAVHGSRSEAAATLKAFGHLLRSIPSILKVI